MYYFIKNLMKIGLKRKGISLVFAYLLLLLISSGLITLTEPPDSGLTDFGQAMWWSVVTSTTVGYGDLYPVSGLGKTVAVFLPMFMGIGLGAAFITHLASRLIERRDKEMHGEKEYKGSGHILVVGVADETEQLIDQIQRDASYKSQDIVLVADIERNPFSDRDNLFFIKGRPDTLATLNKAQIETAASIIIHTGNDEESLFALINALKLKNRACEVTVRCMSSQSLDTFSSVVGDFQVIMRMTAEIIVQAMQDKVHLPLHVLLSNNDDEEIYYVAVSGAVENLTWWALHEHLKERFNYLTFALQKPDKAVLVNPPKDEPVKSGCGIWLMARERPMHIDWPQVTA